MDTVPLFLLIQNKDASWKRRLQCKHIFSLSVFSINCFEFYFHANLAHDSFIGDGDEFSLYLAIRLEAKEKPLDSFKSRVHWYCSKYYIDIYFNLCYTYHGID